MMDVQQLGSLIAHRLTLASVLGLLTWFGINEMTRNEKALTIDDLTVEQSSDWVVLEKSIDSVRVNFRGARNAILRLDPTQLRIVVPVNGNDEAIVKCQILPRHVISPGGVSVESIVPDTLTIRRSRVEASREFTMNQVVVRTLADAGSTSLSVEPQEVAVTVKGAKDSLDGNNLERVRAFVDCVGLAPASSDDIAVQVDLPPGLQLLSVAPKTVNVQAAALPEPEPAPEPTEPTPSPDAPEGPEKPNGEDAPDRPDAPRPPDTADSPGLGPLPLGSDPLGPPRDPQNPDNLDTPGTLAVPPTTELAQPPSPPAIPPNTPAPEL